MVGWRPARRFARLCGRINQGRFWQIYGRDKVSAGIGAFYTAVKFRCHPLSRSHPTVNMILNLDAPILGPLEVGF